ncbi:SH3 domain-containing protein [Chryseobacterium arthrosphaerae]|uniref:SH3 domain-containing protein n=1 Tax=Chryseobacterium arthrosphaerae TaxID=651561 RepID=A0A432DZB0_9FLAO|nr:SH3 domain-containing protein [Chryseobacterium arthrosphaerae]
MLKLKSPHYIENKKIFLAAAILSIQLSFAQFAKIVDKDGYVNLRENPDAKSKITGKISSDEIVYASEPDAANKNWVNVYYNDKTAGYLNTSKVKLLDSYEILLPVTTDETKQSSDPEISR